MRRFAAATFRLVDSNRQKQLDFYPYRVSQSAGSPLKLFLLQLSWLAGGNAIIAAPIRFPEVMTDTTTSSRKSKLHKVRKSEGPSRVLEVRGVRDLWYLPLKAQLQGINQPRNDSQYLRPLCESRFGETKTIENQTNQTTEKEKKT